MSQSLKKAVQNAMLLPRKNKYEKDYRNLMKVYEEKRKKIEEYVSSFDVKEETSKKVLTPSSDEFTKMIEENSFDENMFYFLMDDDFYKPKAEGERLIYEYLISNPDALLVYGDEEYSDMSRFYKPAFSPETLTSYNYINAFAVKGSVLKQIFKDGAFYDFEKIAYHYGILLQVFSYLKSQNKTGLISHIPAVLTSANIGSKLEFVEYVLTQNDSSALVIEEDKWIKLDEFISDKLKLKSVSANPSVSIIIPSKDNPEMLITCIDGLKNECNERTEIIVVDNGSNEENKKRIEDYLSDLNIKNQYIYDPCEFNYSNMNNEGAKAATGDVLLLLNDDIEAANSASGWINKMASKAMEDGIGCVGCKLLYPDFTIQHVGIAGGVDGPAHIFMGEADEKGIGHGENYFTRNVLAVTGATLAVKRETFNANGGLFEELKVGYNDVDLCMSLYEKGLRNVLLNDIMLIHHESVSRGKDAKNRAKSARLKNEKDILKKRHKELMIEDPYMGGCEDYKLAIEKEWEDTSINAKGSFAKRISNDDEGWVYSSFEKLEVNKDNGKNVLYAKGFALVPGIDNMRFDFDLILEKNETQYVIPIERNLRTDLSGRFNGTENTVLCGMDIRADISELESGSYDVKIYAKDHGNVRELITDTEQRIEV